MHKCKQQKLNKTPSFRQKIIGKRDHWNLKSIIRNILIIFDRFLSPLCPNGGTQHAEMHSDGAGS